jgi:diguanylate cyclase (GGDEF)-like protein/PAS domain S-box-containing protein
MSEVTPIPPPATRRHNDLARATLASIGDAVLLADLDGAVSYLNEAAERLTGWQLAEARGLPLAQVMTLIAETNRQPIPDMVVRCIAEGRAIDLEDGVLLVRRDGTEVPIGDSTAPVHDADGTLVGVVLVVQDESEKRRVGHRLSHEATHDPLTGLLNRRGFERRLGNVLGDLECSGAGHVLLYLDLDGFKLINDTWGHEAGDDLLRSLGQQLGGQMRSGDSLARIGGDEFAILLENCPPAEGRRIAEMVRLEVGQSGFDAQRGLPALGASIGLVELLPGCGGVSDVMRRVDEACYRAKRGGGHRIRRSSRPASTGQGLDRRGTGQARTQASSGGIRLVP